MNKKAPAETLAEMSERYRARYRGGYDDNVVVEFLRADNRAITQKWVQAVVHKWFQFGNYEMLKKFVGSRTQNNEKKFIKDFLNWKEISFWVNKAGGNKSAGYRDMADALGENPDGNGPEAIKKHHRDIWRRIQERFSRK